MTMTSSVRSCDRARVEWRRGLPSHSLAAMRVVGLVAAMTVALGCSGPNNASPSQSQKAEGVVSAPGPDLELSDASGAKVVLSSVLGRHAETILVFYRGFW